MKNKKGFTLIELLAGMVILAILAVITTPLVLGYIEDTKKETAMVSAKEYLKAIEQNNMTAKIDENYIMIESGSVEDINEIVKVKGDKPIKGEVVISENKTVDEAVLCINGYIVKYNGNEVTIREKYVEGDDVILDVLSLVEPNRNKTKGLLKIAYLNPSDLSEICNADIYAKNLENYDSDNLLSDGTKSPNGLMNGCMKWYVYKEENDNYYMMLDHNAEYGVFIQSYAGFDYINAYDYLKEITFEWDDELILNKTVDGIDYTNFKARLITADEIAEITGASETLQWSSDKIIQCNPIIGTSICFYNLNGEEFGNEYWYYYDYLAPGLSKYSWLYNYTTGCLEHGCDVEDNNGYRSYHTSVLTKIYGYWTSTQTLLSDRTPRDGYYWSVGGDGYVYELGDRDSISIRPVIEVPKYFFE